jgi:hypothetical protein
MMDILSIDMCGRLDIGDIAALTAKVARERQHGGALRR